MVTIKCLVDGKLAVDRFTINIPQTAPVGDLKDAIATKLRVGDATEFDIWYARLGEGEDGKLPVCVASSDFCTLEHILSLARVFPQELNEYVMVQFRGNISLSFM